MFELIPLKGSPKKIKQLPNQVLSSRRTTQNNMTNKDNRGVANKPIKITGLSFFSKCLITRYLLKLGLFGM
ncbi:hypothetical protein IGI37_000323 [Enterococcus sp. AZ194]